MDILEGVTLFGQKITFQYRNRNARNGADQERRKQLRNEDEHQRFPQPQQNQMHMQYQQLAMAAGMGMIDPNILMQFSYPPQLAMAGSNHNDQELYKRVSQGDRARRRNDRDVYQRPDNHNRNWGGRNNYNNRRSDQRSSGHNYR